MFVVELINTSLERLADRITTDFDELNCESVKTSIELKPDHERCRRLALRSFTFLIIERFPQASPSPRFSGEVAEPG